MEYKSNQHRQMAKVKNILSQIFFPKRLESSSHESYSGSCGDHAQWSLNPENGESTLLAENGLSDYPVLSFGQHGILVGTGAESPLYLPDPE